MVNFSGKIKDGQYGKCYEEPGDNKGCLYILIFGNVSNFFHNLIF